MLPRHVMSASGLIEAGDMTVPHAPRPSPPLHPSSLPAIAGKQLQILPLRSSWRGMVTAPALALAARGPHCPPRPARIPALPPARLSPSLSVSSLST